MSGISDIKKKAKLSIDEMYDTQPVGKLDDQNKSNPDNQSDNNPSNQKSAQPPNQKSRDEAAWVSEKPEVHLNNKQEYQPSRQISLFTTAKQQTQKIPTYKMTFSLTEDIYKAFNDLYAHRMLQGRKTEKSEMICEAIQCLIKMEEGLTE